MLGIFSLSSADSFQNEIFKEFFQEHYQSVKWFEPRSGPPLCRSWSGSKLFAKVISRRQKSLLARLEKKIICNFDSFSFRNPTSVTTSNVHDFKNTPWLEYNLRNHSYLEIGNKSYNRINYRQKEYAFWRQYFVSVSNRDSSKCHFNIFNPLLNKSTFWRL